MPQLWRISNYADLSGAGGLEFSARWNTKGRAVVYLADSPSSAMLEILVHLEVSRHKLPSHFGLLQVNCPEDIHADLPAKNVDQNGLNDVKVTRALGDAWLAGKTAALASVPSVVMPFTSNFLLNPAHKSAQRITIASYTKHPFDARLFQRWQKETAG